MEIIFNNKYKCEDRIGKRRFSYIYKVLDFETKKYYALKFFPFVKNNEIKIFKGQCEREIKVMKYIKNKYIIELKDYFFDEKQEGYCIVMELYDCNLRDILNKYKPNGLPINIIKKIFTQLNEALIIMLDYNINHRDLKPENILIKYTDENKTDFDIKLTDFNFSSNEIKSSIFSGGFIFGHEKKYEAPEVDDFKYNKKNDLWSLGIILY